MTPTPDPSKRLPAADTLLETLKHPIRRATIRYFEHGSASKTTLDELVTHVTTVHPAESSTDIRIQLVHNHLPKLVARGWLEYDSETGEIQYYGHETADQILDELRTIF